MHAARGSAREPSGQNACHSCTHCLPAALDVSGACGNFDEKILENIARRPDPLNGRRTRAISYWLWRARTLAPESLARIRAHPDTYIRNLLLKGRPEIPDAEREFGEFVHISLWEEIARAAEVKDLEYIEAFWNGMPILGPIARSGRWPRHRRTQILTK